MERWDVPLPTGSQVGPTLLQSQYPSQFCARFFRVRLWNFVHDSFGRCAASKVLSAKLFFAAQCPKSQSLLIPQEFS